MKGLITHRVSVGDSLQKLARMYEVDDWREIADINELEDPYINSVLEDDSYKGNKYVASVGDIILIPSNQTYRISTKSKQEEIEAEAYGRDLELYHDKPASDRFKGHLEDQTDVKIVSGISNLAQQLMTRLSVRKGALLLHKDFGSNLYKFVGRTYKESTLNKIRWEVESCIKSDYRVEDVKDIDISVIDDRVVVKAKIVPIKPGKPFDFKYYLKK